MTSSALKLATGLLAVFVAVLGVALVGVFGAAFLVGVLLVVFVAAGLEATGFTSDFAAVLGAAFGAAFVAVGFDFVGVFFGAAFLGALVGFTTAGFVC